MDILPGLLTPVIVAALIFLLHILLPGRFVTGYITKPGSAEKMEYRLNGILVFLIVICAWLVLGWFKIVPYDWFYRTRWYGLAGACTTGIIFSLVVILPFNPVKKYFLPDLFFGRAENLQISGGKVDVKMWLYMTGAIMLELNVLSFEAHHFILYRGGTSPGIFLSTALITYFIVDYFIFERVHLYTYDLFAERVGFKLVWGCLVFYPYFYSIFLWCTVHLPDAGTPAWLLVIYALIFFCGWILARGANMQKYFFKKDPGRTFIGLMPETITDGRNKLLVNGFWGVSRHINYFGEILMATGIILCTGYPSLIWPWLYPFYYIVFLVSRQMDDDKRCAVKYGELWETYRKKVRWRIIPYIY
jgi:protein-S-isoprenylcysteine O-methyltransferase Ste14